MFTVILVIFVLFDHKDYLYCISGMETQNQNKSFSSDVNYLLFDEVPSVKWWANPSTPHRF